MTDQTLPRDLYEVAADDVALDILRAAANDTDRRASPRIDFADLVEAWAREYLTDAQRNQLAYEYGHEQLEVGE